MNMSNYLAAALLNSIFRGQAMTFPTNVYVALYTSDPTKNDTGQEVTGGGYARQQVVFSSPVEEDGKQVIRNSADVVFPVAEADWGTVTHVGIRDAATGGNLLYFGPLNVPRTILTGDRARFLTGQLELTLS